MEQEFGERLKRYRREKNLTQQELADLLQVSNKTVSRWESGGGYPDVPVLVPLARALGVTVDDLLDAEAPVRSLTRADWQNLLSFGFALGGGVLFYLLDIFMPTPVCYLVYLGCMAYGVYLQRHYCYRNRWFRAGNAVMVLAVDLTLSWRLLLTGYAVWIGAGISEIPAALQLPLSFFRQTAWLLLAAVILAAALTAATLYLVERRGFGTTPNLRFALKPRLGARGYVPAVGMLLLTLFWGIFRLEGMPLAVYLEYQGWLYYGLLGLLALLCLALFCRKGRRLGLLPTAVMLLGGLALPGMAAEYAWLNTSKRFMEVTQPLAESYPRFGVISVPMAVTGALLTVLCLLPVLLRLEKREEA